MVLYFNMVILIKGFKTLYFASYSSQQKLRKLWSCTNNQQFMSPLNENLDRPAKQMKQTRREAQTEKP